MATFSFLAFIVGCLVLAESRSLDTGETYKTERDLRRDIFQDYDKLVRPVSDPNKAIPLQVGVSLIKINELNAGEQVLVADSWIQMKWTDDFLQWDPSQYSNISVLRLPNSEVWKPDLSLYSGTPDTALFPMSHSQILVYNDGSVLWVPPFTLRSRCPLSNGKTSVMCNVRFGSWTYSGLNMDIQLIGDGADLSEFSDTNTDWKLTSAVASRESKFYPCCPEDYPLLHFNVTLKRRSGFHRNDVEQHF